MPDPTTDSWQPQVTLDLDAAFAHALTEYAMRHHTPDGAERIKPQAHETKVYLGDAVYAAFDGYYITLTTEDGISVTNRIMLEPAVLHALDEYRRRLVADGVES